MTLPVKLIFISLFLAQMLTVSGAGGLFLAARPRLLRLSRSIRFLVGASCAPYIIGAVSWLMGGLSVRLPNWAYWLPLTMVSLVFCFFKRALLFRLLEAGFTKKYSRFEISVLVPAVCLAASLSVAYAAGLDSLLSLRWSGLRALGREHLGTWAGLGFGLAAALAIILALGGGAAIYLKRRQIQAKAGRLLLSLLEIESFDFAAPAIGRGLLRHICSGLVFSALAVIILTASRASLFALFGVAAAPLAFALALFLFIAVSGAVQRERLDIQFIKCASKEFVSTLARLMMPALLLWWAALTIKTMAAVSLLPVIQTDAVHYASEALAYAQTMSWSDVTGFNGSTDGALLASNHSFLWPAYLANSLLFTCGSTPGYPNDPALSIAFGFPLFSMAMAMVAAGRMLLSRFGAGVYLLFFMAGFPIPYRMVIGADRDAFRLVPIMLLICVLPGAYKALAAKTSSRWKALIVPFALGFMLMAGHPLNAIPALAIGWAFLCLHLLRKSLKPEMAPLYLVIAAGALFGGMHIVEAYLATGNPTGGSTFITTEILADTPYSDKAAASLGRRLPGSGGYWECAWAVMSRDNILINAFGLLAGIFFLSGNAGRGFARDGKPAETYLALLVIGQVLFSMNVFQWSGHTVMQWYAVNYRYPLHLQAVLALGSAGLLVVCARKPLKAETGVFRNIFGALTIFMLLGLILFKESYNMPSVAAIKGWNRQYFNDSILAVKEVLPKLGGRRLLLDRHGYNYYYNNKALLIYSAPGLDMLKAADAGEFKQALVRHGVGGILLSKHSAPIWNDSEMESFVTDQNLAVHEVETPLVDVYLLPWLGSEE
jgi:hypothetical protein